MRPHISLRGFVRSLVYLTEFIPLFVSLCVQDVKLRDLLRTHTRLSRWRERHAVLHDGETVYVKPAMDGTNITKKEVATAATITQSNEARALSLGKAEIRKLTMPDARKQKAGQQTPGKRTESVNSSKNSIREKMQSVIKRHRRKWDSSTLSPMPSYVI